jgi:hypothetical protein
VKHFIKSIILGVVIVCAFAALLYVIPELNRRMRPKYFEFVPLNFIPPQDTGFKYFTENIDSDLQLLASQWFGASSEPQITTTLESYGFTKLVPGRSISFQKDLTEKEAEYLFYEHSVGKRGFQLDNYPQLLASGWTEDTFHEYIDPPTVLPSATAIQRKAGNVYQVAVFRNQLLIFKRYQEKDAEGVVRQVVQCPCRMRYSIFLSDFVNPTAYPRR